MEKILKIETFGLFVLSIYLFSMTGFAWWWYLVLFLVPDFGMLGYLRNPRIGALFYNVTHHLAVAVVCIILGQYFTIHVLELAGIIILGHSAFDRLLGYGLKHPDAFKHTHLGWL